MDTAKTVFILGAGASRDAGAPLMLGFLDEADKLWKSGRVEADEQHFKSVFDQINKLRVVNYNSGLNLFDIESIFGIFEMAKIIQRLPGVKDGEIDNEVKKCLKSLKCLIMRTLEETIRFKISDRGILPTESYDDFSYLIHTLRLSAMPQHSISIITFNYDVALDHALYARKLPFTYQIGENPKQDAIPLLKLHGSLNWGECKSCEKIIPVRIDDDLLTTLLGPYDAKRRAVPLNIGSYLKQLRHDCDNKLADEPVLVPPTWNKTEDHGSLSVVWQKAAEVLSEAENIFVIGYSMPESDVFFRYLYALGTVGEISLRRFWVFDPDESDTVKSRFEKLMGAVTNDRFKYCPQTFNQAIPVIVKEFLDQDVA